MTEVGSFILSRGDHCARCGFFFTHELTLSRNGDVWQAELVDRHAEEHPNTVHRVLATGSEADVARVALWELEHGELEGLAPAVVRDRLREMTEARA